MNKQIIRTTNIVTYSSTELLEVKCEIPEDRAHLLFWAITTTTTISVEIEIQQKRSQ